MGLSGNHSSIMNRELLNELRSVFQEELKPIHKRLDLIEQNVSSLKAGQERLEQEVAGLKTGKGRDDFFLTFYN